jgi:hypothetical protein
MVNSTIPPILTKQTFVSHHKPLNIKKTQHITLEIKVLPGDRYTNVTGLKQLSGFQPSPLSPQTIEHKKNTTQTGQSLQMDSARIQLNHRIYIYCDKQFVANK